MTFYLDNEIEDVKCLSDEEIDVLSNHIKKTLDFRYDAIYRISTRIRLIDDAAHMK